MIAGRKRLDTPLGLELGLLALLALLFGSSYLLIKLGLQTIPPLSLAAFRGVLAAAFLLAVLAWRREQLPRDRRTWALLFVQACLNSIGAWTFLAWGQQYVDSGLASVLNSTSPIFVFFITMLITRHETSNSLKLLGAGLGLFGVTLIVGADGLLGLGDQMGPQLAILLGAIFYAGAAIFGRKLAHLSPSVAATGTMLWAAVCLVPLSLIVEQPWRLQPSAVSLLAIVLLAVFSNGFGLLIYFRLLRTIGSIGVASQSYLRAGVGVILGIVVMGEEITPVIALGIAVAMLGVVAINYRRR